MEIWKYGNMEKWKYGNIEKKDCMHHCRQSFTT